MKIKRTMLFYRLTLILCIYCLLPALNAWVQNELVEPEKKLDISFYRRPDSKKLKMTPPRLKPRNVIFLIGDGMGLGHAYYTALKIGGPTGRLHFEKMPFTGLVRNFCSDNLTPDSAASGTSLATGIKTKRGMVGVDQNLKTAKNIIEALHENGFATGIISENICDATPAVYSAHVSSRKQKDRIADQQLQSGIDVIMGCRFKPWLPKAEGGSRADGRNLLEEAKNKGYQLVSGKEGLKKLDGYRIIGVFDTLSYTRKPEVSLEMMLRAGLQALSGSGKRFFLMAEGAFIDGGAHKNRADIVMYQTLLFDMAVKAALEFAVKDKHTLVIVTADHETGGFAVLSGKPDSKEPETGWLTKRHTASPVPIYAYGPGAEMFTGIMDNTDIPARIAALLDVPAANFPQIR
ncbi:MAG: alkaline phosphatase [Victivallaceae bacterium]